MPKYRIRSTRQYTVDPLSLSAVNISLIGSTLSIQHLFGWQTERPKTRDLRQAQFDQIHRIAARLGKLPDA